MINRFLLIAAIHFVHGAAKNSTTMDICAPTDWSVPWSKVGEVWFTKIEEERSWHDQEIACRKLNHGFARLASAQTTDEIKHLATLTENGKYYWMAGLRIAHYWWRWFKKVDKKEILSEWKVSNWGSGEPTDYIHQDCMLSRTDGTWGAQKCYYSEKAFCELRCDDFI